MAANDKVWYHEKALCVHGYRVYKEIWEAATGEIFVCVAEPGNSYDRNGMAVEKRQKSDWNHENCHGCALCAEERWKRLLHLDY